MIEIDARMPTEFYLLGESVIFNQVCIIKQKPIRGWGINGTQGRIDLICVGLLVLTLSIHSQLQNHRIVLLSIRVNKSTRSYNLGFQNGQVVLPTNGR